MHLKSALHVIIFGSGLEVAQDAFALRAAGITHLVNLTRSARNCAEDSKESENHGPSDSENDGLHSMRVTLLGLKGEPYRNLFQSIAVSYISICMHTHVHICLRARVHICIFISIYPYVNVHAHNAST